MNYVRILGLSLYLFIFFFVACSNEEKEFLTPKQDKIVLDVNADVYSLNGELLGKTSVDISKSGDLLIKPLNNALREFRRLGQEEALKKGIPAEDVKAKFHIYENLSYDDFYKVLSTLGSSGYTSIRYVIGSEYENVYGFILVC